jgi:hypothetical protein
MNGKCPSCGKLVLSLRGSGVDVAFPDRGWKAVTYSCPSCNTILGCQIDPIAVMNDTKDMVIQTLHKS